MIKDTYICRYFEKEYCTISYAHVDNTLLIVTVKQDRGRTMYMPDQQIIHGCAKIGPVSRPHSSCKENMQIYTG